MKWILTKTKKKRKSKNHEPAINILEFNIKKYNIIIYNQMMIDTMLLGIINKDLDKLIYKIIEYLASDEDDEGQTELLFGELAKQRGIYREYEKKMSKETVLVYMKKIRFAAFELKKRLLSYSNQKSKGKSR